MYYEYLTYLQHRGLFVVIIMEKGSTLLNLPCQPVTHPPPFMMVVLEIKFEQRENSELVDSRVN
jgi:hypothetical protein